MALSDAQIYNGDGSTRDFTILGEILSESHLRVWIDDVLQSSDDWDLLGNTVLFNDAPDDGANVQFLVSTTGTDFPSNPSAIGDVSININDVITVAANIGIINTVSTNINDVIAVGSNIDNVNDVASNKTNIDAVVNNKTNIDTVANNINDVIVVSSNIDNVNEVATNKYNIDNVANNKTNIDTVANNKTNIDTIGENISNVINVSNNLEEVKILNTAIEDGVLPFERIVVTVNNIDELLEVSPSNGDTVIVKDNNRGGTFIYDATESAVNNGGTVFDGWVRQYSGAVNVRWFGAKGDGVTDDTVAIQSAISGNISISLNGNFKITSGLTFPKTMSLTFTKGSKLIQTSGTTNIYSKTIADDYPILQSGGTINLQPYPITVGSDKDFTTIQSAVDSVPSLQWQRFTITCDDGTYNEEVLVNNKYGASLVKTGGERAGLQISGTTRTGTIVKAFLVVSSGGSAWNPSIVNLTVNGYNTITNELSSIEYYGCPSGAISNVTFTATGADRCVTSYGSKITIEGLDFGDSLYNYALVTKHGGEIYSPNSQTLGAGTDHAGTLNIAVTRVITGYINACTLATVKTNGAHKHDVNGLRSGFVYDALERTIYGVQTLNRVISNYHTHFETLANFEQFVSGGSSATYTANQGITLNAITSGTSTIWVRRTNAIRNMANNGLTSSQMLIGLVVSSITNDGVISLGNAGSVSEGGYGFEITIANGIRGFYSNSGTRTYTDTIFNYADIVGQSINCFISMNTNRNLEFSVNRNNSYTISTKWLYNAVVAQNSSFVLSVICIGNTGTAVAVFNEARANRF